MKPTRENLVEYAVEPLARWLIDHALRGGKMLYKDAKGRLEQDHGFSTIFPIMLGYPAGEMMWRMQAVDRKVPLLNVLLVRGDTEYPGAGAGEFLAEWADRPSLKQSKARIKFRNLWETTCDEAEAEVRAYGKPAWAKVFHKTFGVPL